MSKPSEFSQQLSEEYVPVSPLSLDEKILAYAREQAASSKGWDRMPWMSAIATFSVAAVALLFVIRTPLDSTAQLGVPDSPTDTAQYEKGASMASKTNAATMSQPTMSQATVVSPNNYIGLRESRQRKLIVNAPPQDIRLPPVTEEAAEAQIEKTGVDDIQVTEAALLPEVALQLETSSSPAQQPFVSESEEISRAEVMAELPKEIDDRLAELRTLVEQDKQTEAEQGYLQLLHDCRCDLPDTLAEALKALQERES